MAVASEAEGQEIAARRIAECRATRSETLDLGGLMLRHVPEEVYAPGRSLNWVKRLYLGPDSLACETVRWWNNPYFRSGTKCNAIRHLPRELFCALKHLTHIDLGHNDLDELPAEIAKLASLTHLDLRQNNINVQSVAYLSALETLTNLNLGGVRLSGNCVHLAALAALENLDLTTSQLAPGDTRHLTRLTALNRLHLGGNGLKDPDVRYLSGLTALERLDLWANQLSGCGAQHLSGLERLVRLDLQYSEIGSEGVRHLACLKKLTWLNLHGNKIGNEGLCYLAGLDHLSWLDLQDNELSDLSPLLSLHKLATLWISGGVLHGSCHELWAKPSLQTVHFISGRLSGVPVEVLTGFPFDNCLPRLRAYFAALEAGRVPLTDVKVMLLGNGRVGKTKIGHRLAGKGYGGEDERSTHGVEVRDATLSMPAPTPDAKLKIWDFGGQDIYHGTHALFVKTRAVFPVVWTPASEPKKETEHCGFTFRNQPLAYWLAYVRQMGGADSPVLVVQSQADKREDEAGIADWVDGAALDAFERRPEVLAYSAKTDRRRGALTDALIDAVTFLRHRNGELFIPTSWDWVKQGLEGLHLHDQAKPTAERAHRLYSLRAFALLCETARREVGPVDDALLLRYLHDTSAVFYREGLFDPANDHMILDQRWALDAVYAVFDRDKGAYANIRDNNGRFRASQLARWVWTEQGPEQQALFLSFMVQCGICFEWRKGDAEHGIEAEFIAPDLLPQTKAPEVQALLNKWGARADVEGRRRYPFLPHGLVRTLMSKIGAEAGINADYWRDGFAFYDGATKSNVKVWQVFDALDAGEDGWTGEIRVATRDGDAATLLARVLKVVDDESGRFGARAEADAEGVSDGAQDTSSIAGGSASRALAIRDADSVAREHGRHPAEANGMLRPTLPPAEKPEWCVSYAWGDDLSEEGRQREAVVERFCAAAAAAGKEIVRDTSHMIDGASIGEFVKRIGRAERVFVFLSPEYLHRWYCMLELLEVWRCSGSAGTAFAAKTRVFVMPRVTIKDEPSRLPYARFWRRRYAEYDAMISGPDRDLVSKAGFIEYCAIRDFYSQTTTILAEVQDRLAPREFDAFVRYGLGDQG